MTNIPAGLTVQIDSREKYPLLFPANIFLPNPDPHRFRSGPIPVPLTTETTSLACGDYRLAEYPDCCIVERKGSCDELLKNLCSLTDSARQAAAFLRLARSCKYPYLLIEASPASLFSSDIPPQYQGDLSLRLGQALSTYKLSALWVSQCRTPDARRNLGEFLVYLMLGYARPRPAPTKPEAVKKK